MVETRGKDYDEMKEDKKVILNLENRREEEEIVDEKETDKLKFSI